MNVIDARDKFAVRRAETEAERVDMERSFDRDMAVDGMAAKLRRKGHTTSEIARTFRNWAQVYADVARAEQSK